MAEGTFERLCSIGIVPSHMTHKAGSELELLSTLITEERGSIHANSFVRGQFALSLESLVASNPRESALAGMILEMSCEQASNLESLSASLTGAGVHLTIVDSKAGCSGKVPATINLWARKHLGAAGCLLYMCFHLVSCQYRIEAGRSPNHPDDEFLMIRGPLVACLFLL